MLLTLHFLAGNLRPQSDKRSSAGNLISPLSQTNGLQLATWYPLSVRQTVFSWQSDIPSHIFWRSSRVSRPENIADFKQMTRLAPPDRIFQYQSLCFYLTHYQSFPHFCRHQIISITADSWGKKARARLINMPSIWIWFFQSGDIQMHS